LVYHTGDMTLHSVRSILKNEVNDVVICQDQDSPARPYYTLVAVKDRDTAKTLLSIFESQPRDAFEPDESRSPAFIKCFSHKEQLCYLFEYNEERNLDAFCEGQITSQVIRERICINIVLSCLSSPLPFPLLFLLLEQRQLHIEKDNTIYFTPYFDLRRLDPKKTETHCTIECVRLLLDILQKKNAGGRSSRASLKSYELLRKKIDSRSCRHFTELYRDIKISALPEKKPKMFKRIRAFWERNKDFLFRIILVLSIIALVLAVIMLASYLIFGDFLLFRLFGGSIDKIGTEQMNIK